MPYMIAGILLINQKLFIANIKTQYVMPKFESQILEFRIQNLKPIYYRSEKPKMKIEISKLRTTNKSSVF